MIGDKYNDWTIIGEAKDRIDNNGKHHKQLLCQCKCGKIQTKDEYKLKKGAKMCHECYLKIVSDNGVPFKHLVNEYEIKDNTVIGHINNSDVTFIIDKEDYVKIKKYCWSASKDKSGQNRISTHINGNTYLLHRFILDLTDKTLVVDHVNRNPLDNRKENLRICYQADNTKNHSLYRNNKSGHNGVFYSNKDKTWRVYIDCDNKRYDCGTFHSYDEALKVRIKKEQELYGEFTPR